VVQEFHRRDAEISQSGAEIISVRRSASSLCVSAVKVFKIFLQHSFIALRGLFNPKNTGDAHLSDSGIRKYDYYK